jgi:hypothetical protein
MAKFAFWNVQRIGNMDPKNEKAADRVGIFQMYVEEVVTKIRPSFFVLAEVTSQGDKIVSWLQQANWNAEGYTAEFVPVNHGKNPCNYLVIKKNTDSVRYLGITGSNVQRPYVTMQSSGGIKVAFAHLKSGGSDKTAEELMTFLWDLADEVHALCGDLNLDYHANFSPGANLGKEVSDAGFKTLCPPVATYQKEAWNKRLGAFKHTAKTLDFLVYHSSVANRVSPIAVDYAKEFHALIDHAPIAFQIRAA